MELYVFEASGSTVSVFRYFCEQKFVAVFSPLNYIIVCNSVIRLSTKLRSYFMIKYVVFDQVHWMLYLGKSIAEVLANSETCLLAEIHLKTSFKFGVDHCFSKYSDD